MFDCTAIVWRNNVPTDHHIFPLPNFGDPNFNRTIRSYSAFRGGQNTSLWKAIQKARKTKKPCVYPAIRTALKDKDEWDVDFRLLNQSLAKYKLKLQPEPNWIRHESLWDFYKAVGYDYKTQRYISTEDCASKLAKSSQVKFQKACVSFKSCAVQHVRQFRADWQREAGHPEKISSSASVFRAFTFDNARREG
jgi:hypothetical protein